MATNKKRATPPGKIRCLDCGIPIPDPGENPDPDALLCDSCCNRRSEPCHFHTFGVGMCTCDLGVSVDEVDR